MLNIYIQIMKEFAKKRGRRGRVERRAAPRQASSDYDHERTMPVDGKHGVS